jgi:hypothetical protein
MQEVDIPPAEGLRGLTPAKFVHIQWKNLHSEALLCVEYELHNLPINEEIKHFDACILHLPVPFVNVITHGVQHSQRGVRWGSRMFINV